MFDGSMVDLQGRGSIAAEFAAAVVRNRMERKHERSCDDDAAGGSTSSGH